jgi:Acetylornithine deacetylase/Succinyl-diaminopimelate desuccinylase and related deacylases
MSGKTSFSDNLENLLFNLVSINSANPDYSAAAPGEEEIGRFIYDFFTGCKIDCVKQNTIDGRFNVIAKVEGKKSAPAIVLCSHLDTVYLDGMDFKPFMDDINIYGPGSCDTKASVAMMMSALINYSKKSSGRDLNVYFAGVVSEESRHIGIRKLIEEFDSYIGKADFFIIGEPTNLDIGIAHKGSLKFTIKTKGKNAHGSTPHLGLNAINMMGELIVAINNEIVPEYDRTADELLGKPTINIGTISGGRAFNIVPDNCCIEIDRRMLPSETVKQVLDRFLELIDMLKKDRAKSLGKEQGRAQENKGPAFDGAIDMVKDYIPYLMIDKDNKFLKSFERVCKDVYKKSLIVGLPYATDGGFSSEFGIPTVVFGPGDINNCHRLEEFVSRKQLRLGTMILSDYLSSAVL